MELYKEIITAKEAAKLLGVSEKQVYVLCQEYDLPHWKPGRIYRFFKDEVIAWRQAGGVRPRRRFSDLAI